MRLLEKAIASISPNMALKREVARRKLEIMNSGYGNYGANEKRRTSQGWKWGGGGPKEDIDMHVSTLREKSRDLYCGGAPIATSALKTTRTNVVGSGLRPRPHIDAEFLGLTEEEAAEWERKTIREFDLFADTPNCDMERLNNFYELQQLAFLSWIMNGDVFALLPFSERPNMPYDLRIQLIEADRVKNPTVGAEYQWDRNRTVEGVEKNAKGEIVAYHIANYHPLSSENVLGKKFSRVLAYGSTGRRNVLHCMMSERIGQCRGIPLLSPVIEALKDLGRYTNAELLAAVVSGYFAVFIETDTPELKTGEYDGSSDEEYDEDYGDMSLSPGMIMQLNKGDKATSVNPGRPNTAFDGFVNSLCRQIGAALEIPPELLLKQFTNNYSASRGALLEAWKTFKMYRSWLANDFCQPIYEEWLLEAVAKGRIYAPGFDDPIVRKAYSKCEWSGPSQGQLDPVKEANAAKIRVEEGFSTRQQETKEMNGGDFYDNNAQRLREEKARVEVVKLQWQNNLSDSRKEEGQGNEDN